MRKRLRGMSEKRLREKILQYAGRLEKTDPDLAEKIRKRVDELVAWYVEHGRDITLEEFQEILEAKQKPLR